MSNFVYEEERYGFGFWLIILTMLILFGCLLWEMLTRNDRRWESFKHNINRGEDVVFVGDDEKLINKAISKFAAYGYCLKQQNARVNGGHITSTSNVFVFYKCR